MAYITGQTIQGCCLPVKYLGNDTYACEPNVGELHKKHKIYNDYHMWYVKIIGQVGERITIRLKWPQFDPDKVSEEYKSWDSYSADWPSFFETVPEVIYYSADEVHWDRVEGAVIEGDTVVFSQTLSSEVSYLSTILHYTPANFADLLKETARSPYVQSHSLCKGWDGGDLMTFTATDFSVPTELKKTIYFQAAQHCPEHPGPHVCDFMLRYLANPDDVAKEILKKCIFRITPVVDRTGWTLGCQCNPLRAGSLDFNYNRDWGAFKLPETKAIAEYLKELKDNGERLIFLADLHGGTGDEDDYSSGAGITFDNRARSDILDSMRKFNDMVRKRCDYLNPQDSYDVAFLENDTMFSTYASRNLGPGYSFEFSMSKMWDRAAGKRLPNSQAAFERFAKQLVQVLGEFSDEAVYE